MNVKNLIPQVESKVAFNLVKEVFKQYHFAKKTPGNRSRDEFVKAVDRIVGALKGRDKNIVRWSYLTDPRLTDKYIVETILKGSISRSTYKRRKMEVVMKLFIMFYEQDLIQQDDEWKFIS